MGKGENAGYQDFLYFPQYFQKASIYGRQKVGWCIKKELTKQYCAFITMKKMNVVDIIMRTVLGTVGTMVGKQRKC